MLFLLRRCPWTLTALIMLVAGGAAAEPPTKTQVAVFPVLAWGEANGRTAGALETRLEGLLQRKPHIQVVPLQKLDTLLGGNAGESLRACGNALECIFGLGEQANLDFLITVRLSSTSTSSVATATVIDIALRRIRGTSLIHLADPESVAEAIERLPAALFELPAMQRPKTSIVAHGPPAPPKLPTKPKEASKSLSSPDRGDAVTADSPTPVSRYAGVAIGSAGVAAVVLAIVFEAQARSKNSSLDDPTLTQFEAQPRIAEVGRLRSRANIFYGIGGGLLLAGAVTFSWDWLVAPFATPPHE